MLLVGVRRIKSEQNGAVLGLQLVEAVSSNLRNAF